MGKKRINAPIAKNQKQKELKRGRPRKRPELPPGEKRRQGRPALPRDEKGNIVRKRVRPKDPPKKPGNLVGRWGHLSAPTKIKRPYQPEPEEKFDLKVHRDRYKLELWQKNDKLRRTGRWLPLLRTVKDLWQVEDCDLPEHKVDHAAHGGLDLRVPPQVVATSQPVLTGICVCGCRREVCHRSRDAPYAPEGNEFYKFDWATAEELKEMEEMPEIDLGDYEVPDPPKRLQLPCFSMRTWIHEAKCMYWNRRRLTKAFKDKFFESLEVSITFRKTTENDCKYLQQFLEDWLHLIFPDKLERSKFLEALIFNIVRHTKAWKLELQRRKRMLERLFKEQMQANFFASGKGGFQDIEDQGLVSHKPDPGEKTKKKKSLDPNQKTPGPSAKGFLRDDFKVNPVNGRSFAPRLNCKVFLGPGVQDLVEWMQKRFKEMLPEKYLCPVEEIARRKDWVTRRKAQSADEVAKIIAIAKKKAKQLEKEVEKKRRKTGRSKKFSSSPSPKPEPGPADKMRSLYNDLQRSKNRYNSHPRCELLFQLHGLWLKLQDEHEKNDVADLINRTLKGLYHLPCGGDGAELQLLNSLIPRRRLTASGLATLRSALSPLSLEMEVASLADLAMMYPHTLVFWRLLGSALTDQKCNCGVVFSAFYSRFSEWFTMFFRSKWNVKGLSGLPIEVFQVWVLLMSYLDDEKPSALVETVLKRPRPEKVLPVEPFWPEGVLQEMMEKVPEVLPLEEVTRQILPRSSFPKKYEKALGSAAQQLLPKEKKELPIEEWVTWTEKCFCIKKPPQAEPDVIQLDPDDGGFSSDDQESWKNTPAPPRPGNQARYRKWDLDDFSFTGGKWVPLRFRAKKVPKVSLDWRNWDATIMNLPTDARQMIQTLYDNAANEWLPDYDPGRLATNHPVPWCPSDDEGGRSEASAASASTSVFSMEPDSADEEMAKVEVKREVKVEREVDGEAVVEVEANPEDEPSEDDIPSPDFSDLLAMQEDVEYDAAYDADDSEDDLEEAEEEDAEDDAELESEADESERRTSSTSSTSSSSSSSSDERAPAPAPSSPHAVVEVPASPGAEVVEAAASPSAAVAAVAFPGVAVAAPSSPDSDVVVEVALLDPDDPEAA